ncbi:MAG: hypothetical protein AAB590_02715 [Patescibacteria group bacterium]
MRDIFFDPKKKIVRLKREEPIEKIIRLLRRLGAPATSALSIFLVALLVLGYQSFVADADVAYFYPGSCLGDWQNPNLAAEGRDTGDNPDQEEFTEENSAVLKSIAGRIYCGSFEGSLPEKAIPTDVSVGLAFTYKNRPIQVEVNTEAVTEIGTLDPEFTATSTLNADTPASGDPAERDLADPEAGEVLGDVIEVIEITEVTETAEEEVVEKEIVEEEIIEKEIVEEEIVEPTPEPVPDPVSWLLWGTSQAFAQEIELEPEVTTSTPEVIDVPEEILQEIPEVIPETEIPEVLGDSTTTIASSTTATTTTTTEEIIVTGEVAPISENENIAEILYTLDGETWISVGYLNKNDESGALFIIPSITVTDIANMQISIQAIDGSTNDFDVYLDSVWAEVRYTMPLPEHERPSEPKVRPVFRSADFITLDNEDKLKDVYQGTDPSVRCEVSPLVQDVEQGVSGNLEFHASLPSDQTSAFRVRFGDLPNGWQITDMSETYFEILATSTANRSRTFNFSVNTSNQEQFGQTGVVLMYDTASLLGEARTAECAFSIRVK